MRMPFAIAALMLFSVAAHAQRVDTRRVPVGTIKSATACRFEAAPDLVLLYPQGKSADEVTWHHLPLEIAEGGTPGIFTVAFKRVPRVPASAPFGVAITRVELMLDRFAEADRIGGARLEIDGTDSGIALARRDFEGLQEHGMPHPVVSFQLPLDDQPETLDRVLEGRSLTLVVLDKSDAPLARYAWDIHYFREIPELLDLVHWSCASPDRG